jgi:hypothetical protein
MSATPKRWFELQCRHCGGRFVEMARLAFHKCPQERHEKPAPPTARHKAAAMNAATLGELLSEQAKRERAQKGRAAGAKTGSRHVTRGVASHERP